MKTTISVSELRSLIFSELKLTLTDTHYLKHLEIMNKLDIKPFLVGFIPLCAFDNTEGKFYAELKIDREATLEELKTAYGKALPFAVDIGYSNEDTIKFLIGKAGSHEKVLKNLKPAEETQTPEKNKEEEK